MDYTTPMALPKLPPLVPTEGGPVSRGLGAAVLRTLGWHVEGEFPDLPKMVCIMVPHTSNWDFVVAVAFKFALGIRAVWIGKHTLFVWPFGVLLRRIGGMPVERSSRHAFVQRLADEFARREQMIFALAPEGTRKRVERWRSGYWHVAHTARVPIVPVGFDFARRVVVIGAPLHTTESQADDEQRLREFAQRITPRHPANYVA